MHIFGNGAIRLMHLPDGWQETEPSVDLYFMEALREFKHKEDPTVEICIYYRGQPIAKGAANRLLTVLDKPSHTLTGAELDSVSVVLRDASDSDWFDMRSARTETLKGRKVLVCEGVWKRSGIVDLGVFIDRNGDGSEIEELHYKAPENLYQKFLGTAGKAFRSIMWNR